MLTRVRTISLSSTYSLKLSLVSDFKWGKYQREGFQLRGITSVGRQGLSTQQLHRERTESLEVTAGLDYRLTRIEAEDLNLAIITIHAHILTTYIHHTHLHTTIPLRTSVDYEQC